MGTGISCSEVWLNKHKEDGVSGVPNIVVLGTLYPACNEEKTAKR